MKILFNFWGLSDGSGRFFRTKQIINSDNDKSALARRFARVFQTLRIIYQKLLLVGQAFGHRKKPSFRIKVLSYRAMHTVIDNDMNHIMMRYASQYGIISNMHQKRPVAVYAKQPAGRESHRYSVSEREGMAHRSETGKVTWHGFSASLAHHVYFATVSAERRNRDVGITYMSKQTTNGKFAGKGKVRRRRYPSLQFRIAGCYSVLWRFVVIFQEGFARHDQGDRRVVLHGFRGKARYGFFAWKRVRNFLRGKAVGPLIVQECAVRSGRVADRLFLPACRAIQSWETLGRQTLLLTPKTAMDLTHWPVRN